MIGKSEEVILGSKEKVEKISLKLRATYQMLSRAMTLYDIMFFKQRKEKLEIRIAIEMTEAYDSFAVCLSS